MNVALSALMTVEVTRAFGLHVPPLFSDRLAKISYWEAPEVLLRVSNQLVWMTPDESDAIAGMNCWPVELSLIATGTVKVVTDLADHSVRGTEIRSLYAN